MVSITVLFALDCVNFHGIFDDIIYCNIFFEKYLEIYIMNIKAQNSVIKCVLSTISNLFSKIFAILGDKKKDTIISHIFSYQKRLFF